MKVTREIKSAINRRATFVARALPPLFVTRMKEAVESDKLVPVGVEAWWPPEFDPVQMHAARAVAVGAADVYGAPDGSDSDLRGALADLLGQVQAFIDQYGEADFETARARAALGMAADEDAADPLDAF